VVAGSLWTTTPPMATSLVRYRRQDFVYQLWHRVSFPRGYMQELWLNAQKGDEMGMMAMKSEEMMVSLI
jgi:hypothetical protein